MKDCEFIAEGEAVLSILRRLLINAMLLHRVENKLKWISMSASQMGRYGVAVELKLYRGRTMPLQYFLEIQAVVSDAVVKPTAQLITMDTNAAGFVTRVDC